MKLGIFTTALAVVAAAAAVSGARGLPAASAEPLKVGFVYVGPVGDHGWTYRHDIGRRAVEEEFGDKVSTTFVESVNEGPDAERVISRLASEGHDLIFTTSFGFMNPTIKAAERFPDVRFEHATGYKRADNVSTYAGRFYEGRYVSGVMAGHLSEGGVIGYVGSFPIPEVVRGVNAFLLGARSVRPDIRVQVVWVNSWYDPGRERDAAQVLIDRGADVITQHTDSPAPLQAAAAAGVYAFGQASDMIAFAPDTQVTAVVDNWDRYYVARARAVLDGDWESSDTWGGLDTGMVEMAAYTNVPESVASAARAAEAAVRSGEHRIFTGPLVSRDGVRKIGEGEVLDDDALLAMDWFLEGVEGELPN
ncbi:MAG: BMP family ABC transporter substrate-binding protein [Alphaproteobacteria bacterium]|nr:BMP family ABC transporter substrate-binding protein [Alphaproteobacteria bacterium]MDA7987998.1 BMP family ABC transporter substrate-binding protein [Alphaproteobacteria bacterium]MDA8000431.1 BMP family ABC transporter substrate-binding protein [Alphaproteobacteria bacterium]MDA8003614.1 BMP family ABC transporter substrate-binding protein [Alphaproteobacteria bacterium]MDA8005499.1 BMP family ABC transporter substrate-binding protein [Alphaproteobacteria bacterium]